MGLPPSGCYFFGPWTRQLTGKERLFQLPRIGKSLGWVFLQAAQNDTLHIGEYIRHNLVRRRGSVVP